MQNRRSLVLDTGYDPMPATVSPVMKIEEIALHAGALPFSQYPTGKWITGPRREMFISDMDDGHLLNTIRYLYRFRAESLPVFGELVAEASRRHLSEFGKGQAVCDFGDSELGGRLSISQTGIMVTVTDGEGNLITQSIAWRDFVAAGKSIMAALRSEENQTSAALREAVSQGMSFASWSSGFGKS